MNVFQIPNKNLFKSVNVFEAFLWNTFNFIDCGTLDLNNTTMKKEIKTTNVTPIETRVAELHRESISWFRKFLNVFIEIFPMTKSDAITPKSVETYSIGKNKVVKKPGINASMSKVISPFKKIKEHMNILSMIVMFLICTNVNAQFRLSAGYMDKIDFNYNTPLILVGSSNHTFITGLTITEKSKARDIFIGYAYKFNKIITAGTFTPLSNIGKSDFMIFAKVNHNRTSLLIGSSFNATEKIQVKNIMFGLMYDIF